MQCVCVSPRDGQAEKEKASPWRVLGICTFHWGSGGCSSGPYLSPPSWASVWP